MNKDILIIKDLIHSDSTYNECTLDDIKFTQNQEVQDILLKTYLDILKYCTEENDQKGLDKFYNNFINRLLPLNDEEREYVYNDIKQIINKKNQKIKER